MRAAEQIKLVYILGVGHSGSTLLDLMLGTHSQIVSVGEACTFDDYFSPVSPIPWSERGCACGTHVERCPYWSEVRARLNCGRAVPFRLSDAGGDRAFFAPVLAVSGKRVVCDSSKNARRARALLNDGALDCTVIYLVRDGRAVAYSYKRLRRMGSPVQPPWDDYYRALRGWAQLNARFARELAGEQRALLVRYEDVVADPRRELTRVLDRLGLAFEERQTRFWEQAHHSLCGNRMRMSPAKVIRNDDEYLAGLTFREWYAGSALVLRLLRLHGYPLRRGAAARIAKCPR